MSKHEPQSEGMNALEQSLNDHMEICRLKRKAKRLKSENARLKAEVERLTSEVSYDNRVQLHVDKLAGEFTQAEVERLKAEVERLRASSFVTAVPIEQYERVIKAGDAMADAMWYGDAERSIWVKKFAETDWNAAKEGKPIV